MHVICKKCGEKIAVANQPKGSTTLSNAQVMGNVNVGDGGIRIGSGGSISFGPGGGIGFGAARSSLFLCMACGTSAEYEPDDIMDDTAD